MDFGKITFKQEYEDGQTVVHTIRGDSSTDEVIEAFELFLKGAGYHLPEGCHIGYEYDEDSVDSTDTPYGAGDWSSVSEPYTITINGENINTEHSHFYWDLDRNK